MQRGPEQDSGQTAQRVRVGVTGLAIVLLLILLASAVVRSVGHERASRAALAANLAQANSADPSEPLAEIGVAPSGQSNDSAPTESGRRGR